MYGRQNDTSCTKPKSRYNNSDVFHFVARIRNPLTISFVNFFARIINRLKWATRAVISRLVFLQTQVSSPFCNFSKIKFNLIFRKLS